MKSGLINSWLLIFYFNLKFLCLFTYPIETKHFAAKQLVLKKLMEKDENDGILWVAIDTKSHTKYFQFNRHTETCDLIKLKKIKSKTC